MCQVDHDNDDDDDDADDNDDGDEDDDNDDDVWNDVELGEAGWGAGRNNMIMRPSVCCAQIGGRRPHQPHHVKIHTFSE